MRKWQVPALMTTGLLPLYLMMGAHIIPENPWLAAAPLGMYAIATMLCVMLPGRWRVVLGAVSMLGIFAAGYFMLPWERDYLLMGLPLLGGAMVLVSLPMTGWTGEPKVPPFAGFVGVGCHIALQLMQIGAVNTGTPERYAAILPYAYADFVLFAFVALMTMNRNSLRDATLADRRAPTPIRRKNTVLTVALLAIVLLIATMPAVIEGLTWLYNWTVAGVVWLVLMILRFFHGSGDDGTDAGGSGGTGLEGLMEGPVEQNPFMEFLERVAVIVALIAAAVLIIIALYFLGKKLWRLLKKLWDRLGKYVSASSEDYQDEVVDTREKGEVLRAFVRQLRPKRDPLKKVDESKLSPVERIRYRYLKLWLNHPYWGEGATARENLTDSAAADLYDRARYSDHEISAGEAEEFARRVDGK